MLKPRFGVISMKVTFWVAVVVIAVVAIHIYVMQPERRFFEQKMRESERIAQIIESHLLAEMKGGAPDNIQHHMELLPGNAGIHRVEIFSPEMEVRFSSDRSRVGQKVDRYQESPCVHCHLQEDPPPRVVYDLADYGRVFAVDHTLLNRGDCVRCHADKGPVLGNILVEISLTDHDLLALSTRKRLMYVGGVLLVLMLVGMGAIIHYLVGRPAKRLLDKMDRVRRREFDVGAPVRSADEFESLERGFHEMVDELQGLYDEMESKIQERTHSLSETQAQVMHQEKLANIGQLAAGVAHEIGNPLTAIDSLVQLMAVESDDAEVKDKARVIQEQVDRISDIVHGMADLSRPLSLKEKQVDVNGVVRSVIGLLHFDARFKKIDVSTRLHEELPWVHTVEDRLFGAFLNLALNAADAMPQGGTLEIETESAEGFVVITFSDSGEGIPDDVIGRIFDPYFTTKSPGAGTGLGLSMCRTFFENSGGDIAVERRSGGGTAFRARMAIGAEAHATAGRQG